MILLWTFAQIFAFQLTKVEQCFGNVFYQFTSFGFKNVKINFLNKIRVLSAVLAEFITNPSSQVGKTPNI